MNRLTDYLDKHLVPEWRAFWKRWSVRLSAGVGFGVAAMIQQPDILFAILGFIPADPMQRALAAIGIGITAWFAPTILVLLKQSNLAPEDKPDDAA